MINNKIYIGQSIQDFDKKINQIKNKAKNGRKQIFFKSIRKYGFNNFNFEIIKECNNTELDFYEDFYIKEYDSIKNGYNIQSGGKKGYRRPEHSKRMIKNNPMKDPLIAKKSIESRKNNGTDVTGKTIEEYYHSIETVKRVKKEASKRMIKNNPMKNSETVQKAIDTKRKNGYFDNIILSDNTKQKISKGNSKKWLIIYPSGKKEKIINMYNFCKENNLNCGHMSDVAKNNRIQHKGFKCKKLN